MIKEALLLATAVLVPFLIVMFIAHHWSGWNLLARHYRLHNKFHGKRWWTFVSARMGKTESAELGIKMPLFSLRSALNIRANDDGIRLSLVPPFGFISRPLFVPWADLSIKILREFLSTWVEFHFREAPGVALRVRERVGREVIEHSPKQLLDAE
jgi:hypothetical protein